MLLDKINLEIKAKCLNLIKIFNIQKMIIKKVFKIMLRLVNKKFENLKISKRLSKDFLMNKKTYISKKNNKYLGLMRQISTKFISKINLIKG